MPRTLDARPVALTTALLLILSPMTRAAAPRTPAQEAWRRDYRAAVQRGQRGDVKAAVARLEVVAERAAKLPQAPRLLVHAYTAQGRLLERYEDLEGALAAYRKAGRILAAKAGKGSRSTQALAARVDALEERVAERDRDLALIADDDAFEHAATLLSDPARAPEGLTEMTRVARAGHPGAARQLGLALLLGKGGEADAETGVEWLTVAADHGDVAALTTLARLHFEGARVPKDHARGARFLRRAAAAGDPVAAYELARVLTRSIRLAVHPSEARSWLAKAAAGGHPDAQVDLGVAYLLERGGATIDAAAFVLFTAAGRLGHPAGLYNLGLCHWTGRGTPENREQARQLFREASGRGSRAARRMLEADDHHEGSAAD